MAPIILRPCQAALIPSTPLIELVHPEGRHAGPDPRGAKRRHIECHEEVAHLPGLGWLALAQQHGQLVAAGLGGHKRYYAVVEREGDKAE